MAGQSVLGNRKLPQSFPDTKAKTLKDVGRDTVWITSRGKKTRSLNRSVLSDGWSTFGERKWWYVHISICYCGAGANSYFFLLAVEPEAVPMPKLLLQEID